MRQQATPLRGVQQFNGSKVQKFASIVSFVAGLRLVPVVSGKGDSRRSGRLNRFSSTLLRGVHARAPFKSFKVVWGLNSVQTVGGTSYGSVLVLASPSLHAFIF